MGHRGRRQVRERAQAQPKRRRTILGVLVGVAALVLVAGGAWYAIGQRSETVPVTFKGGPRLEVDRDTIDFGPQRFETRVKARFALRNVGDQPLRVPGDPPVLVVQGC